MTTFTRPELRRWAAQHGVITGSELRARGLTPGRLRTLIRREHLLRAHRDVFFVFEQPTNEARWLAAVLHCGSGALLSHLPAAVLWRLLERWSGRPHVTVPHHRITKPPKAIRVHRSSTLTDSDRWEIDGIPVTSLHRTLDDLSRQVNRPTLKAAVRQAERRHQLDLWALHARSRSPRLRRVLEAYVPGEGMTDSPAEAIFLKLCGRSVLPPPEAQRRMPGGRADFAWPSLRLLVEVDGYDVHGGLVAFQDDRTRDRRNKRTGWETLRFTWRDLTVTPQEVVDDLDAAAARQSALVASRSI